MYNLQDISAYAVSKTALLSLVKVLSHTCGPHGIRVNSVAPGLVNTDFAVKVCKEQMLFLVLGTLQRSPSFALFFQLTSSQDHMRPILNQTDLKRIAEPEEISGMLLFLCSHEASYITGENFAVAGGGITRL